ncbi:MAG: hypothetical protein HC797_03055 [Anaerolineales bacterium]|nr:hypothetical protein [Anaerolineales bacterium]
MTYLVAKQFSFESQDEKVARISAWIVACYPMLLVYPIGLGTENLFFVLLLLSFLFHLKSINQPSASHFLFAGIFLALTSLTRSVILPFAGLSFLYLIYLHRKKQ